jgi:uncharacterized membrane protein (DUF4010 family)
MLVGATLAIFLARDSRYPRQKMTDKQAAEPGAAPLLPTLESPFSLTAAFKFGVIFLVIDIAGTLAQRAIGETGFYVISAVGGLLSSASAVASAANLTVTGTIPSRTAANGAIIASAMSALINLPLVARLAKDRVLTLKTAGVLAIIVLLAVIGCIIQAWNPL